MRFTFQVFIDAVLYLNISYQPEEGCFTEPFINVKFILYLYHHTMKTYLVLN